MVSAMPKVDFDFQRYVERRKGALAAQAREGAAYAYSGDLKVLRTLDKLRPVRISVEATVRLWGQAARAELLGSATRVTAKESPRLFSIVETLSSFDSSGRLAAPNLRNGFVARGPAGHRQATEDLRRLARRELQPRGQRRRRKTRAPFDRHEVTWAELMTVPLGTIIVPLHPGPKPRR